MREYVATKGLMADMYGAGMGMSKTGMESMSKYWGLEGRSIPAHTCSIHAPYMSDVSPYYIRNSPIPAHTCSKYRRERKPIFTIFTIGAAS